MKLYLTAISFLLVTALPVLAQPPAALDVKALFRDASVVDGLVNYYSPTGLGQPHFGRKEKRPSVKAATGIDIGTLTIHSTKHLERERAALEGGRYSGARLIRSRKDIELCLAGREFGVLLYSQTHFPLLGKIDRLRGWYAKGLRIFMVQYGAGDGNQSAAERLGGGSTQEGGLTRLGRRVVLEAIRLGMIVDVSHCNEQTVLDVCRIAQTRGVPVLANHTASAEVLENELPIAPYDRNMTDREVRAIAATGGVVGVMAYVPYLRRRRPATVDDYVTHVLHMIRVGGVGHVGFSSDGYLDGRQARDRKADGVLDAPRRWMSVVERLHQRGVTRPDLLKLMGGNFLRVYRQVLK